MFLLIGEQAFVYWRLSDVDLPPVLTALVEQFHHHPWHGLRFWDLIQPFFMFIVGVAMPFSIARRRDRGQSESSIGAHIAIRCLALLGLGVGLHCLYSGRLVWELWNVLSQLSVTILIAYVLMGLPWKVQLAASAMLLLGSDLAYRFFPVAGFDQPFVKDHNFGSWADLRLMGKLNPGGGWVAINCIPTAAHTIWGVLAGQLLMGGAPAMAKVRALVIGASLCLLMGYGLDTAGVAPIIKRICTSSFVLASGGWCLLALAACYWMLDVKGWKGGAVFFVVVGMNPLFIYLFAETVGNQWVNGAVLVFVGGVLEWLQVSEPWRLVAGAFASWALFWALCYWLWKRRIFIRI